MAKMIEAPSRLKGTFGSIPVDHLKACAAMWAPTATPTVSKAPIISTRSPSSKPVTFKPTLAPIVATSGAEDWNQFGGDVQRTGVSSFQGVSSATLQGFQRVWTFETPGPSGVISQALIAIQYDMRVGRRLEEDNRDNLKRRQLQAKSTKPTNAPISKSVKPTKVPTSKPIPTTKPSKIPTVVPIKSAATITNAPSTTPFAPSSTPTRTTNTPTNAPITPSVIPTAVPSKPTVKPTKLSPTKKPTIAPVSPTSTLIVPTSNPSNAPVVTLAPIVTSVAPSRHPIRETSGISFTVKPTSIVTRSPYLRDVVYAGDEMGNMFALDLPTGSLLWRTYLGYTDKYCGKIKGPTGSGNSYFGITGTPVFDRGADALYSTGGNGTFYALSMKTGDVLWTIPKAYDPSIFVSYGALSIYNGIVYVPYAFHCDQFTEQGKLTAISTVTRQIVNTFYSSGTGGTGAQACGVWEVLQLVLGLLRLQHLCSLTQETVDLEQITNVNLLSSWMVI